MTARASGWTTSRPAGMTLSGWGPGSGWKEPLETPLDAAAGHLALEKGGKDSAVTIRAWIDDVQLELLEAP